ncbi:MAG: PIG-L deacetylase family protein [Planctomycetota bacterium]|jgi:LmbE family N-acetylglucosaminyl deacetylase
METETEGLDVIAVGAHPDDIEIACGGTLAALVRAGYRVGIIDLTDGEPTPLCPSPEVRRTEASAAAAVLGVHVRKILGFSNRRLMDGFEERIALATEFRRYRPKVIIGFGSKTPMASPDHYQAMQITDAAVFYSRLTKWDDFFGGLPVHTIDRQLYFRLAFEPAPANGLEHSITMDISETLEQKIESIGCYKTQFPPAKAHIFERVRGLAIAAGAAAHCRAGEVFVSTRPLRTSDLVRSVMG